MPAAASPPHPKVALVILDGWGLDAQHNQVLSPNNPTNNPMGNAIAAAQPSHFNTLWHQHPHWVLQASGASVGLPPHQASNSEVGHLALGCGQTLPHERLRMDELCQNETLGTLPTFERLVQHVRHHRSTLHVVVLASTGGVHGHVGHLAAVLNAATEAGLRQVRVHAITDGRDVPAFTAMEAIEDIEGALYDLDLPQLTTVCGRFFAMDRDQRWERTTAAFEAIALGRGQREFMAMQALRKALEENQSEEFITPCVCDLEYQGVEAGDAVLLLGYRPDRMRQLTEAFLNPSVVGHANALPAHLHVATLSDYGLEQPTSPSAPQLNVVLPKAYPTHTVASLVAQAGWQQFRVAETEKYAHVTQFFNGGHLAPVAGEERCLVPSPQHVPTYDLAPEMSLAGVNEALLAAITSQRFALIVANWANADMVAHTGQFEATVQAVQCMDRALPALVAACQASGTHLLLTADHGQAEGMLTPSGQPNPAHTANPVPLVWVAPPTYLGTPMATGHASEGTLTQVAGSVLHLLGLPVPHSMAPSLL